MAKNMQSLIASLMNEDMGMSSSIAGGSSAHQDMSMPMGTEVDIVAVQGCDELEDEPEGYTERELKLAKRFIELVGGADRARELLDKVDECEECLDLVDDEEAEDPDVSAIQKIAGMVPMLPDLPTSAKNGMDLSTLYNPSAVSGAM